MTPAPSIVYSAVVINKASTMVRLRITYAMPEGSNVMEHVSIGPGGTLRLEEKTVQRGSAVFARHIHRIAIDGITHQRAVLQAPFKGVHSPVKDYVVEIYPMGGRLELRGVGRAK